MDIPSPPKYVQSILLRLESHGFPAYLVGGCVRDILMERRPHDWDICTAAAPHDIMRIFPHSRPTGIAHGTVTVVINGRPVEVTTFRSDGQYLDNRHPDSVSFVSDIETDLQRRDFTMNAIACPLSGGLCDPFGGVADISQKIIRCVGEPERRFSEDALRMLRALRFSAALGFEIEKSTLAAISKNAPLAVTLAAERISAELEKALLSPRPQLISDMIFLGLLCGIPGICPIYCDLSALRRLPKTPLLRWSGLCALLMRGGVISDPGAFLKALKLPSSTLHAAAKGCEHSNDSMDTVYWKRLVAAHGVDTAYCAAASSDALYGSGHLLQLRRVLFSDECCTLDTLNINGSDLKALGLEGTEIGRVLRTLLDHVITAPLDNEKIILLRLGENLAKNGM